MIIKKILASVLTASIILTGSNLPVPEHKVVAGATTINEAEFKVENGVITDYNGKSEFIAIPSIIGGEKITAIGDSAFYNKKIKGVIIPEGIERIGESSFEGHDLSILHIPDSVTDIGENAFKREDYNAKKLTVTGMKGITELKNASFANNQPLQIEGPSLTGIKTEAFEVQGWGSKQYVVLYTTNDNVNGLESIEGEVIVDPYTVTQRCIVRETGQVLKTVTIVDEIGNENFSASKSLDSFFTKGQKIVPNIQNFDGYYCMNSETEIELSELNTIIEREYKEFTLDVPIELTRNADRVSGRTLPNAEIAVSFLKKEGYYGLNVYEKKTVTANPQGEFNVELELPEECVGMTFEGIITDSKGVKLRSNVLGCRIGETTKKIKKFTQFEDVELKQFDDIAYPDYAEIEFDDETKEIYVDIRWEKEKDIAVNPGIDWIRGYINYTVESKDGKSININKYPVSRKLIVRKNEEAKPAVLTSLYEVKNKALSLANSTQVSSDGKEYPNSVMWVTKEVMDKLLDALKRTNELIASKPTDQTVVDNMVVALENECSEFSGKRTPGTKGNDVGTAEETKKVSIIAGFEQNISKEVYDSIRLVLKRRYKEGEYRASLIKKTSVEEERVFEFEHVPYGAYKMEVTKGYVLTDGTNKRAPRSRTEFILDENSLEAQPHLIRVTKGIRVGFTAGENGSLIGENELYYLSGENLMNFSHNASLEVPEPKADKGYRFKGWSVGGVILSSEEVEQYVITEPIEITAVFEISDFSTIDENTPIQNDWVLGDFTYGTDSQNYPTITGLSLSGKMKLKRNINIVLPDVNPYTKERIKTVDFDAFKELGLNSVIIPEGIEYIWPYAFCDNELENVTLPKSLKLIGNFAFQNNKLGKIELNDGLEYIRSGAFWVNQLETVDIPDTVKEISSFAFSENKLRTVNLNSNLELIGDRAFESNELTIVEIPFSLNKLHDHAFFKNKGVAKYNGKVVLFTPDKKSNPSNLVNGVGHIINPELGSNFLADRTELKKLTLIATKLRNELNFSDRASEVPSNEKYISLELGKRVEEAIYEGHYAYYDNSIPEHSQDGRSIEKAENELSEVIRLMRSEGRKGEGSKLNYTEFRLIVGIPGISIKDEVLGFEMVLKPVGEPYRSAYKSTDIYDVTPHTAWMKYQTPKGRFKFVPDVGYCLTASYNGVETKERNPYVNIPADLTNGAFDGFGFGATEGRVLIFDLGEHGSTMDERIETVMKGGSSTEAPVVKADQGYRFRGWSLNGKDILALESFKVYSDLVIHAVYEEDDTPIEDLKTEKLDSLILKAGLAKIGVKISSTGKDVARSEYWVDQSVMESFEYEINYARNIRKTALRQEEIDSALTRLQNAINVFEQEKKPGTGLDEKSELRALYQDAELLKENTRISETGLDVDPSEKYVTKAEMDELTKRIVEASWQLDDEDAKKSDIDKAREELIKAIKNFTSQLKKGKKNSSSDSTGGSSGGGSTGSNAGGGSSLGGSFGGGYSGGTSHISGNDMGSKEQKVDKKETQIREDKVPLSNYDREVLKELAEDISNYRLKDIKKKGFRSFVKNFRKMTKLLNSKNVSGEDINLVLRNLSLALVRYVDINTNEVKISNVNTADRKKLYSLVLKVENIKIGEYDTKTIIKLFNEYEKAVKLLNSKKTDFKKLNEGYINLSKLIKKLHKNKGL